MGPIETAWRPAASRLSAYGLDHDERVAAQAMFYLGYLACVAAMIHMDIGDFDSFRSACLAEFEAEGKRKGWA